MRTRVRPSAYATPLLLSVAVAAFSLAAGEHSQILRRVAIEDLMLIAGVVGFYIFVGNSGVLSFGHVCFVIIGAYTAALLATPTIIKQSEDTSFPRFLINTHAQAFVACLAGGAAAAIAATAIGIPLMKLSGTAAALSSFALLQIVQIVASQWQQVTNGELGLSGVPLSTGLGAALGTAVGAIAIAFIFQESRWGARLRASREDEVAARALGISVRFERRLAFAISAFVMGVVGGLYVQFLGAVTPTTFYLNTTFLLVVMLIVGGQTSLSGAVIGGLFVSVIREALREIENGFNVGSFHVKGPLGLEEVGLALILIFTLILRPSGLTKGRELTLRSLAEITHRVSRSAAHRPDEETSSISGTASTSSSETSQQ